MPAKDLPDYPPSDEESYYLLLSLYHPTETEIQQQALAEARYRLLTRRGWIFSIADTGQRRRAVRMLAEGSLLSGPVIGNIVDVTPPAYRQIHSVYRSGLALTVHCRRWSRV
jgi:CRISPR type III-A-associated RAMP protein Csm4